MRLPASLIFVWTICLHALQLAACFVQVLIIQCVGYNESDTNTHCSSFHPNKLAVFVLIGTLGGGLSAVWLAWKWQTMKFTRQI